MTTEEIKARLEEINTLASVQFDDGSAHVAEDKLFVDFISYVASLDNYALAEKARLVLSSQDFHFYRWTS